MATTPDPPVYALAGDFWFPNRAGQLLPRWVYLQRWQTNPISIPKSIQGSAPKLNTGLAIGLAKHQARTGEKGVRRRIKLNSYIINVEGQTKNLEILRRPRMIELGSGCRVIPLGSREFIVLYNEGRIDYYPPEEGAKIEVDLSVMGTVPSDFNFRTLFAYAICGNSTFYIWMLSPTYPATLFRITKGVMTLVRIQSLTDGRTEAQLLAAYRDYIYIEYGRAIPTQTFADSVMFAMNISFNSADMLYVVGDLASVISEPNGHTDTYPSLETYDMNKYVFELRGMFGGAAYIHGATHSRRSLYSVADGVVTHIHDALYRPSSQDFMETGFVNVRPLGNGRIIYDVTGVHDIRQMRIGSYTWLYDNGSRVKLYESLGFTETFAMGNGAAVLFTYTDEWGTIYNQRQHVRMLTTAGALINIANSLDRSYHVSLIGNGMAAIMQTWWGIAEALRETDMVWIVNAAGQVSQIPLLGNHPLNNWAGYDVIGAYVNEDLHVLATGTWHFVFVSAPDNWDLVGGYASLSMIYKGDFYEIVMTDAFAMNLIHTPWVPLGPGALIQVFNYRAGYTGLSVAYYVTVIDGRGVYEILREPTSETREYANVKTTARLSKTSALITTDSGTYVATAITRDTPTTGDESYVSMERIHTASNDVIVIGENMCIVDSWVKNPGEPLAPRNIVLDVAPFTFASRGEL